MMDAPDAVDDTPLEDGADTVRQVAAHSSKDYLLGIALLLVVVVLWTASNFVTQYLFEEGYEKPFLVTYLNTSAFAFYLLPWSLHRLYVNWKYKRVRNPSGQGYEALADADNLDAPTSTIRSNFRAPSMLSEDLRLSGDLEPLTTRQTAKLASVFCLFWFIANWSVNWSLDFTSVASATVLSSTSGFFTLLVGRVFRVESMTLAKICAVVASFAGVVLVSVSDSRPSDEEAKITISGLPLSQLTEALLGDGLALLSAIFYALYVILLKVRIKEESRINMQLFFGFVGVFNVLMLWPIGLVLHFTGVEQIALPSSRRAWVGVLVNMLITLSSDYLYVVAMLKTTPLVVTIGLSLTIPLAIVGDFFLKVPTAPQAIMGAIFVSGAFIVVGVENAKSAPEQQKVGTVPPNEGENSASPEESTAHT